MCLAVDAILEQMKAGRRLKDLVIPDTKCGRDSASQEVSSTYICFANLLLCEFVSPTLYHV